MKTLVIDNGLFPEFAARLARSSLFSHVGYFAPWQADFVATCERAIGTGYDEFERVWDVADDTLAKFDSFCFPDLYWGHFANNLSRRGYPTWSAGEFEEMELDRVRLLETMAAAGMKTPTSRVVTGVDEALSVASEGDIIKITGYARGDMETMKHDPKTALWAQSLRAKLGPLANEIPIIVQKPVPSDLEPGFDWIVVNGRPLNPFIVGYEGKDSGYLGHVTYENPPLMAEAMRQLERLLPTTYTNFLSTEFRNDYLIDLTCRTPSPPGDAQFALWENFPEIVYGALTGELVDPVPENDYFCQLVLHNKEPHEYGRITVPRGLRSRIAVHRGFFYNGDYWTAPQRTGELREVAGIVGSGRTAKAAIEAVKNVIGELKMSPNLSADDNVGRELLEVATEGALAGVPF